ncbi:MULTISPECIES: riboflavin synthase [Pseudoalteromonas]|jgi:riboflavin synthase|uniref:Riboflavin synthase n=1 Tax=Pseudoalteromonas shioyasakiensis TaxID=1190813 RepID=A0ABT6U804_9GAMM|nr:MULTISPECIES: riboflavin synthase [Pseudoalteromonas]KPM76913.1 riboflavin synthase subunit alpha [Pseudoalteromonas sp. UCD-33C]KPW03901.1 Riboflavin synthase [Pseudoalteromonas sp. P1-8]KPZ68265.1 Riboflavin synthase [Pseudoalteromonas sp. P1-26]KTG18757.1 riboflavin synthase subunit alpha [Pseudoalteromonas sp. XI10]MAB61953.1 riboflavin synthase [Pseudoalteromonas sp.]|tara:strand:+ start:216 stop:869 length:654 start_codon:yes stop_codon:yes gene_type:complete
MFTGIIEATGKIVELTQKQGDLAIRIQSPNLDMKDVKLGDSIATNGVCLTVVAKHSDGFSADLSNETISLTGFAHYKKGQTVNLEKAMQPVSRLGGHLVSGHVDGIATVESISPNARATEYWLSTDNDLMKYIPYKGSVCIDGISLTVNEVEQNRFKLTIVPHTAEQTTIAEFQVGTQVNLEVDQIARYLERLIKGAEQPSRSDISMSLLAQAGFIK